MMMMIGRRTEERDGGAVPRVLEGVILIIAGTKAVILARHSSFGSACGGGLGGRLIIGMDGSRAGRSFEFGRCGDGIIIIGARGRSGRSVSL